MIAKEFASVVIHLKGMVLQTLYFAITGILLIVFSLNVLTWS